MSTGFCRRPSAGLKLRSLLEWAAVVLVSATMLEIASALVIEHVARRRAPFLFFSPPSISDMDFQRYLRLRDPVLGWPRRDLYGTDEYDLSGSRPIPSFRTPGRECISAYGDSFTYGFEVTSEEAWSNRLSVELGCRVANYGVPGYGTDQAFLRYQANLVDSSAVVILGVYLENIVRVINQYRYLLEGQDPFTFKPRLTWSERKGLEVVPIPIDSTTDIGWLPTHLSDVLKHEWFLPGTTDGPTALAFPSAGALLRTMRSTRFRAWRRGEPSWTEYFDDRHPSGALLLLGHIVTAFDEIAKRRGSTLLVVIFPTGPSFRYLAESGTNVARPLISRLEAADIDVVDLATAMLNDLSPAEYCALLTKPSMCGGHYTRAGNLLVAHVLRNHLARSRQPDDGPGGIP